MIIRVLTLFWACAILAWPAHGFEVAEFRSGMSREKVREILKSWKFDKIYEASGETLLAYDQPEKNGYRQFQFDFCNDKLARIEQAMKPSTKNFIVISNNYIAKYGQPFKVDTGVNVVSAGEKNSIVLNWRRSNELIGVRYSLLPAGEELVVTNDVPNSCWPTPRAP